MADDYLRQKIAEAISASGGNRHDAQKLLITWAVRDQQLLLSIAKPHLRAIVAGLVDHSLRPRSAEQNKVENEGGRTAIDDLVASATLRIPLDKRKKSNLPPPKSTERQASTMRRLAEAFSKKKK